MVTGVNATKVLKEIHTFMLAQAPPSTTKANKIIELCQACSLQPSSCHIRLGNPVSPTPPFGITNSLSFIISNKDNKYIVVGCSIFGYLTIYSNTSDFIVGCVTQCHNNMSMDEGHCSGNGCCKVDIPTGITTTTIQVATYLYCSYSFVIKNGYYSFSKDHLENLPY
ncbi:hypothetical protein HN51_017181 [Arachis hypogaea]